MNPLLENTSRRIGAISIFIKHADNEGVSNTAKSAYYRSATIIACTIVEGLVFQLVKKKTRNGRNFIATKKDVKRLHSFPTNVFNKRGIVLAKEEEKKVYVDNAEDVSLQTFNRFLKREKIVNETEFRQLEYTRKERNRLLHFQEMGTADIGHTKRKLEQVSRPIFFLLDKLAS